MVVCLALGMAVRARGRRRAIWWTLAAASAVGLWLYRLAQRARVGAAIVLAVRRSGQRRTGLQPLEGRAGRGGSACSRSGPAPCARGCSRKTPLSRRRVPRAVLRDQHADDRARGRCSASGRDSPTSRPRCFCRRSWHGPTAAKRPQLLSTDRQASSGSSVWPCSLSGSARRSHEPRARFLAHRLTGGFSAAQAACMVFLGTCLTGHPLLVGEVAYPFWILFGLTSGLAGSVAAERRGSRRSPTARTRAAALATPGRDGACHSGCGSRRRCPQRDRAADVASG